MSRYEELVKAFGRGEHESYVSLERHEEFARKLLSGIQSNFEIPRDQLHLYPLTPNAPLEEEGLRNALGLQKDGWFGVGFRFDFESPNTSLPVKVRCLIRFRRYEEGHCWLVQVSPDGGERAVRDSHDTQDLQSVYEELFWSLHRGLERIGRPPEPQREGMPPVGFDLEALAPPRS
jgi:hypothetical protein